MFKLLTDKRHVRRCIYDYELRRHTMPRHTAHRAHSLETSQVQRSHIHGTGCCQVRVLIARQRHALFFAHQLTRFALRLYCSV